LSRSIADIPVLMSTQTSKSRLEQAIAQVSSGRHAEAKAALLRLIQQTPRDPAVLSVLVATLSALKEYDAALYYAKRAVEVAPKSPGALANRARVYMLLKRVDEGLADLRAALAADPSNVETRAVLAQVLENAGRLDEAMAVVDEAGEAVESSNRLLETRSMLLLAMGRADEALAIQRRMIPRNPSNPAVAERAANTALYAYHSTCAEIKELASRFGRLVSVRMPVARPPLANNPDPERRLRVGFIGGDFRNHAIMRFFEPMALSYDRQKLEFRCYMTMPHDDAVTAVIRSAVDHFEHVHTLRFQQLAERLRGDQLDIVIDLAGHTVGNRIECFHHRPAPLQLTWFGQPSTPGLTAFDYRIVDSHTDPIGTEGNSVERLLRIEPCGFAFRAASGAPDVQPPPSQREDSPTRGTITFGSYSNLTKMNDETFALWAKILNDVPGSTLLLRHTALGSPGVKADVHRRLAAAGLGDAAVERVQIFGPAENPQSMMNEYHRVDIALDTFPYSGMTTTCESLWMGVPVVSLAMDRSASRYSMSILTNCGMSELVAHTPEDYVRIAVELARDPARLAQLRSSVRERMSRVVCNGPDFAKRFETAMRAIWREWCATRVAAN
jgi:predicted O-linked N-acetylglucosamine transferase (SPINDLY family)